MKTRIMTTTKVTGSGQEVTVAEDVEYYVPKAGDVLNIYGHMHTLTEDMELGIEFQFNAEERIYTGSATRTSTNAKDLVFYADGFSWRQGEYFEKAVTA